MTIVPTVNSRGAVALEGTRGPSKPMTSATVISVTLGSGDAIRIR